MLPAIAPYLIIHIHVHPYTLLVEYEIGHPPAPFQRSLGFSNPSTT